MVTITPNQITNFKMQISKGYNEYASAETTTIYGMQITRHNTDANALDLIFSIRCQIITPKHSAFERFVANHNNPYASLGEWYSFDANEASEIIITTGYTLKPMKDVHGNDIYVSALKTIDRLQETLNTLYKHESNIPIINVFSEANFIDQANAAIQDFFAIQEKPPGERPRFI